MESSARRSLVPDKGDKHDRVRRNGASAETARLAPKGGRRDCDFHREAESACPREHARGGLVLDAALFPERLLQPRQMTRIDQVSAPTQGAEEAFSDGGLSEGGGEAGLLGSSDDDFDAGDDLGAPLGKSVTHDKRKRDKIAATLKVVGAEASKANWAQ